MLRHRIQRECRTDITLVPTYVYSLSPEAEAAPVDMDWLETRYRRMYRKNDHFCIIADGTALSEIGVAHLDRLVRMLQDLKPKTEAQVLASAIIITNHGLRTLINALMCMYKPVSPMAVVDSMDQAKQFVRTHVNNWAAA